MDEPVVQPRYKIFGYTCYTEIRRLQKKLGITCIYVTHDQKEALAMADRIAVLNEGKGEQVATPFELFTPTRLPFAADFIGQINILKGKASSIVGVLTHECAFSRSYLLLFKLTLKGVLNLTLETSSRWSSGLNRSSLVRQTIGPLKGKEVSTVFLRDEIEYAVEYTIRQPDPA